MRAGPACPAKRKNPAPAISPTIQGCGCTSLQTSSFCVSKTERSDNGREGCSQERRAPLTVSVGRHIVKLYGTLVAFACILLIAACANSPTFSQLDSSPNVDFTSATRQLGWKHCKYPYHYQNRRRSGPPNFVEIRNLGGDGNGRRWLRRSSPVISFARCRAMQRDHRVIPLETLFMAYSEIARWLLERIPSSSTRQGV